MYREQQVAVVIPAFNEQELIGKTVATLPRWVDHVLVVDDGSQDATEQAARAAAHRERRGCEILRHDHNRGVGAAIATGYRRALELGADIVVVVGADAQMDPADLPALIDAVVSGAADYAKGNRLRWPGVTRIMPRHRWVGNWVLTWLTRPVSGCWTVTDSQCGYTAVSRRALASLPLDQLYPRYGYPNDLLAWLNEKGMRVVDVPVRPIYDGEKSGIRVARIILPLLLLLLGILLRRLLHRFSARRRAALPALPERSALDAAPAQPVVRLLRHRAG